MWLYSNVLCVQALDCFTRGKMMQMEFTFYTADSGDRETEKERSNTL